MPTVSRSERGHRILPHTADLIIEAWGPERVACLEEAVAALVDAFADVSEVAASEPVTVSVGPGADHDLLVELLEEVIFAAEVLAIVPVGTELSETEEGGVSGFFEAAPVESVEITGAVPKAVSHHELAMERKNCGWWCRAVIDV